MSDLQSDLQSDSHDRSGPTPEQAKAARREAMSEHQREVEDLIDRYTGAVKDDGLLDFFHALASELVTLRNAVAAHQLLVHHKTRLGSTAREIRARVDDFLKELDAAKDGE